MKKIRFWLAVAACFALNPAFTNAQPMLQKNLGKHFREMDTNHDGVISKAEFDAAHTKHFNDMDSNRDNQLSMEEMRAGHQKAIQKGKDRGFDAADADKNGMLTREEVKDRPGLARSFDKMDTNKDGKLSREEMEAALQKRRPAQQ